MNYKSAFSIGVIGALTITVVMAIARLAAMTTMNLEMMLGSMVIQSLGPMTWLLGLGIHVVAGGVFALIYAAGFEYAANKADWKTGLGYGGLHTVFSGLLMSVMPAMHPLMLGGGTPPPGYLMAPGPFAVNFGVVSMVAFIALHLLYGAIVGAGYSGPSRESQKTEERPERDEEAYPRAA